MQKNLEIYPIRVEPMEEGGYFSTCPLLQGCHAEGETFAEAISNIQDVILAHIECRRFHGEVIPSISLKKQEDFSVNLPLPILAAPHVE